MSRTLPRAARAVLATSAVLLAPAAGAGTLLLALPAAALAQVGSTTDILTGKVTGHTGEPIEGAIVTATSVETGVSRSRTTNAKGQYTILFPDGGGRYRLTVRAIGQTPATVAVQREGDEDRLFADVKLGQAAAQLSAVRVTSQRAPQGPPGAFRPEPGNSERVLSAEQTLRLPVDASDPNAVASLAPGVIQARGNDSTAAGFNVAGQRPTQNNVTLDGASFGASFPQEAVRGTRVITNTFDVARGQFSGGQVAATTRSGTNTLTGSGTYTLRDPSLQWRPSLQGAYGQGYTQNQLSLGVGGPIVRDRAFWFGAAQLSRRTDPLQSLLGADPAALQRLGASPDSVARFLGQLDQLGVPTTRATIPGMRENAAVNAIVRLDWTLADAHTLTLRGDWRRNVQDASRVSPLSVPITGGDGTNSGAGVLATLTSRFGGSWVNEARVYASDDRREAAPYIDIPGGRVRVSSTLADNSVGVTSLGFGANPSLPNDAQTGFVEAGDEVSWLSSGGGHRVKLGGLLNASRYDQRTAVNPYGTYTYNSLADFLSGTPAAFTRSLAPRANRGGALNAAGYLGDTWRQSRNLQVTYGLRLEGSRYTGAPARNAEVEQAFGLRTDAFPDEVRASPRVGFTWTHFPAESAPRTAADSARQRQRDAGTPFRGGPTLFVRGGIGEFRGRAPSSLFSAAQQGSGLAGAESQLVCVGAAVPLPDYARFMTEGPSAIPTTCAPVADPSPAPAAGAPAPTVTAFADDFRAPRSWRASLGASRRFWERWNAGVDVQYAWGRSQYGVRDRNLATTPRFTLADEGGRPVFVPAEAIVPATGASPLAASRVDPRFAQVLEVNSSLASRNAQMTATLGGFTRRGVAFNLSYTYARNTDQSSFGFGAPVFGFAQTPTAGDPNRVGWAPSDFDTRHNVIGTVTWPFNPSIETTVIGRVTSGQPYTPIVGSDVNGDGARNDRAFVFDPAAAQDAAVRTGMERLLAGAPEAARACLQAQMGGVAGRNTCRAPWFPSLDLQLNYKPDRLGLKRRLTLSVLAINSLVGLDQLLHGSDDLRGWGQPVRPDPTLLVVRGFDQASQRYRYEVNERFGSTRGLAQAFRQPFQIGLQARFSYGQNPFGGFFGGGGGAPGGGVVIGGAGGGGQNAAGTGEGAGGARFGGNRANPVAQIIDLRDSLALDSAQVLKLEGIRDSLSARSTTLGEEIRALVAKQGNNPDPAVVFSVLRPKLAEGRANMERALEAAEQVLTPAQWAKVPERVKNPMAQIGGPGGSGARP